MAEQSNESDNLTLREVIGAILQDVAESRFTSDRYSRDMSRYYEQDDIMRLFPVPRTEINELELELKFAFSDVFKQKTRREVLERRAIHNFVLYSSIIARQIILKVISILEQDPDIVKNSDWKDLKNKLQSQQFLRQLEGILYDFFYWGIEHWLSIKPISQKKKDTVPHEEIKGEFNLEVLLNSLVNLLFKGSKRVNLEEEDSKLKIKEEPEQVGKIDIDEDRVIEPVFNEELLGSFFEEFSKIVKTDLTQTIYNSLQDMKYRFEFINRELGEANVYVDVTANKLSEIEFNRLSTIRVKTSLKNYIWTELDTDRRSRLIAE